MTLLQNRRLIMILTVVVLAGIAIVLLIGRGSDNTAPQAPATSTAPAAGGGDTGTI